MAGKGKPKDEPKPKQPEPKPQETEKCGICNRPVHSGFCKVF
jgi:hypothetical protein